MSWKHVQLVLESTRYKGPTKGVLLALTCHLNADRIKSAADYEVWPGKKTLIRISGWGETTVEKAIGQLDKDGVVEILQVGVGKETSHYRLHLDKLVDRDATQGGPGDDPRGPGDDPGVGRETTPNREAGTGKEKSTEAGIQLDQPKAKTRVEILLEKPAPAKSNTAGTSSPHPNQEHTCPGPVGDRVGKPAPSERTPSCADPLGYKSVARLLLLLIPDMDRTSDEKENVFIQVREFCKGKNPHLVGLTLAWAIRKSNYWSKRPMDPHEFIIPAVYDEISKQYDRYHEERKPGKRPEDLWPDLKSLCEFWLKAVKKDEQEWEAKVDEMARNGTLPQSAGFRSKAASTSAGGGGELPSEEPGDPGLPRPNTQHTTAKLSAPKETKVPLHSGPTEENDEDFVRPCPEGCVCDRCIEPIYARALVNGEVVDVPRTPGDGGG